MNTDETYRFSNGWTMRRSLRRPNPWVLKDEQGKEVDRATLRRHLIVGYGLEAVQHTDEVSRDMMADLYASLNQPPLFDHGRTLAAGGTAHE